MAKQLHSQRSTQADTITMHNAPTIEITYGFKQILGVRSLRESLLVVLDAIERHRQLCNLSVPILTATEIHIMQYNFYI